MIKAHSLLYAVYVCLIVALLCSGLLLVSNLYDRLDLYYATQEDMYLNNESAINYALGNSLAIDEEAQLDEATQIRSSSETRGHGLLTVMLTRSFSHNDTITSALFVGQKSAHETAFHLCNFSKPLSVTGKVILTGDIVMPAKRVTEVYLSDRGNHVDIRGEKSISGLTLPAISEKCKAVFGQRNTTLIAWGALEKKNDSLYVNSFFEQTKEIQPGQPELDNVTIKGNFVISRKDSIVIGKNAHLEDVIIIAPKITVSEGFKGTVQLLATDKIAVGRNVQLNYPSVACIYTEFSAGSQLVIDEGSQIHGLVLMFGNNLDALDSYVMDIREHTHITGTVYCSGTLQIHGEVWGSVFTERALFKTKFNSYAECIADIVIDVTKVPGYFMDLPVFDNQQAAYGIIKKVL